MNNPLLTYGLVQLRRLTACRGQGALEYIAIAVILIILIVAAFQFIGGRISDQGGAVGNAITCPDGQQPVGTGTNAVCP